jgi:Trk K+ transport system NAD-binding subunit
MLRKIGVGLLCAAASLSTTVANSTTTHVLQKGMTVEYELLPNEPQVFINYLFWAVEANCIISSEDDSNDLLAEALARKGAVNGVVLSAGESMHVEVHAGENLKLRAESGAKVQITNFGQHSVKATCTA